MRKLTVDNMGNPQPMGTLPSHGHVYVLTINGNVVLMHVGKIHSLIRRGKNTFVSWSDTIKYGLDEGGDNG